MTAQSAQVTLQTDLRQLEARTRKWQLRFNEEKCKIMHLKQYNHHYDYTITIGGKDTTMGETTNERDLGAQIDHELKFDQQMEMVANKANKMLGLIRRSFTNLDGSIMKKIYTSLVRLILEYGNAAWSPTLERDQQMIKNIQRRATKLVPELKTFEFGDRLRALKLPSLYYRRARGDMIETYKYLRGIYNVDRMPLELDNNTVTRGHSLKLKGHDCKTTKELLQAQGCEPVNHPHRVCSFSTLIKYFQIKTRQILVRLVLNEVTTFHPCAHTSVKTS